jgi:hypothetical protein
MNLEDLGDIEALFDLDDFGVTALIGAEKYEVEGHFDKDFLPIYGSSVQIDSAAPAFHCPSHKLKSIAQKQAVILGSENFYIKSIHPNNDGVTTLILRKE